MELNNKESKNTNRGLNFFWSPIFMLFSADSKTKKVWIKKVQLQKHPYEKNNANQLGS